MCVNSKWIYNKYLRQSIFVGCGHCPACLQQKANSRTSRIKNNVRTGEVCVFITLTYSNNCVPFVLADDLRNQLPNIPVYRISERRVVTVNGRNEVHTTFNSSPIAHLDEIDSSFYADIDCVKLPYLRRHPVRRSVGVIFYSDVQNFIKRLRINLSRRYNYNHKFSFFICSEYGETFGRPHFHLLLFIPRGDVELFRDAVTKSWLFADGLECGCHFEIARDAASYVSSYVNCTSSLPKILTARPFRPKCSYSKGFGAALRAFSPSEIQKKVVTGILTYSLQQAGERCGEVSNLLIPRYVINRLFPKFAGYFRFTDNQIFEFICRPTQLYGFTKYLDSTPDEIRKIVVSLDNAFERYHLLTGVSRVEYAFRFIRTWSCYSSTMYRLFMERSQYLAPEYRLQEYDNIADLYFGHVHNLTLERFTELLDLSEMPTDPNVFLHRRVVSSQYSDLFYLKQKTRKVNEIVYESGI